VLLRQAQIPFETVMLRFDSFDADSAFKQAIAAVNPAGKVPVLQDGDLLVWDTLAIAEYVAETFPDKQLWPAGRLARARARSVCAEMHAGFGALRSACPMNIEASLPEIGALAWRDQPAVRADVARLVDMWSGLLDRSGGPLRRSACALSPTRCRYRRRSVPMSSGCVPCPACAPGSTMPWRNGTSSISRSLSVCIARRPRRRRAIRSHRAGRAAASGCAS
jgi:glutathione S-transferase